VKRLISIGVLIAILATMLMPLLAGAMIISEDGGGGPQVLTSGHIHHLGTVMGMATITYTFKTYWNWDYDKLTVRIQVWVSATAQYARADAYVDRVHYYKILWWYIKGWDRVFHESNTAVVHNIHGGWQYSDLTWNPNINPWGTEYKLYSTLHTVDPLLQYADDDLTSYITPDRDPTIGPA
jgi:hypothetical protein